MGTADTPAASGIRQFPFETDGGVAPRAAIGLVVLATDQTIEHEFRKLLDLPGVALFESRIYNSNQVTPETLRAMEGDIKKGVDLILPGAHLDVVGFGCTSATMMLGEETVGRHIRRARPGIAFTTPVTAAFAGFRALGARRVAVLTPYMDEVNEGIRAYVERSGFQVPVMGSFKEIDDLVAARISPASIMAAAEQLVRDADVDALFVSCTSMRIALFVDELERRIGIPATSSNHAMAWHCLRLAGIDDRLPQFGRLYTVSAA